MKKEIKYGDFVTLGWNAVPEEMHVDFLSYLNYFVDSGIAELENRLTTQFELKSLPNRSADDILEEILACTPKELDKSGERRRKKLLCLQCCVPA